MTRALLQQALDAFEAIELSTRYMNEEDEIGEHSCCNELSYKPHAAYCWTHKKDAAITAIRKYLEQPEQAPIAQGPVDVNVSHLSPDDLMKMNGYLAGCVSILIEACKTTAAGRKELCKWDKHRGTGAN
jgi:hypothetical protein